MISESKSCPAKGEFSYDFFAEADTGTRSGLKFLLIGLARSAFDRFFALSCVVVLAPVLLLISALVFFGEGGPVFYRHRRIGLGGRHFDCLKFRSMALNSDARLKALLDADPGAREEWRLHHKLTDDPRVTCIGRILRVSSLDELPQFFNVLLGDMSIVGPRPICKDELADYGSDITTYIGVKPGITGAWQVCGRSSTTFEERVKMDVEYCRDRSFALDLRIILKTIPAVFSSKGAQ